MTLSKRLKALEKEMEQSAPARATGHTPNITLEELQEKQARIREMTPEELKKFYREEFRYPAPGIAPGPGELPHPDDEERMSIHAKIKLFFVRREEMTPREWQAFYTKLLEEKP